MEPAKKISIIRYIYLYLLTTISIVIIIVAAIGSLNLALKEYVFDVKDWSAFEDYYECADDTLFYSYDTKGVKVAKDPNLTAEEMKLEKEECTKETKEKRALQHSNDLKRDLVYYLSMLIVGLPLYVYHWGIIRKEHKK